MGGGKEKTKQLKQRLTKELEQFIAPRRQLLEPLKDLSDRQMRAVVTLAYLMEGMTLFSIDSIVNIRRRFAEEISTISPMLATAFQNINHRQAACMDLTVEYLTKEKECQEKGDSVACNEAGIALSNLAICEMRQLNNMKGIIVDLWKGKLPNPPWPTKRTLPRKVGTSP